MKRLVSSLQIISFFFLVGYSILSAQVTDQPILSLNTTMHTTKLDRLDFDAKGKYVLTCSLDKTAKLWDAKTGDMLRTFRPPIDAGDEGKLFSCALSPDGYTAVLGGWTSKDGLNNNIYIFNAQTGEMIHRIEGLKNVIRDIEYSKDGSYIACALGSSEGVAIFETGSWTLKKLLDGYVNDCYNVTFDQQGRLATVCDDGKLRLYDASFDEIKEVVTTGGKQPFSLAFSPDGIKLAVGFDDTPDVQVYDGTTLDLLYDPDVSLASGAEGYFKVLTFSEDGTYLFGGGSYNASVNGTYWFQIRRWDNQGKGRYIDIAATKNSVMDIKTLPGGDIVYGGFFPDFARMHVDGTNVYYFYGEHNDFSAKDKTHFRLDYFGNEIGFTPFGGTPYTFNIGNRTLTDSVSTASYYTDATTNLNVTNWQNSPDPLMNGKTLTFMGENEHSRSVDISDDETRVVVGADWNIYCLDSTGTSLWSNTIPTDAWAVNISGNGKVVASGLGDGTIRFYRMTDGKELLSLFVHSDLKRWILWTPSGYYDCSAGAEDLIGWHINNGLDKAADFFTASKFRSTYYRPDVISKILQTYDEDEALRLANSDRGTNVEKVSIQSTLPPVIEIISPADGSSVSGSTVTVKYNLRSPSGEPVTGIKALVNGRPIETKRGVEVEDSTSGNEMSITIPQENCEVSLIAENKFAASDPSTIRLVWSGQAATQEFIVKPKLYVLSVGVSDYKDPELKLELSAKDATDFAASLKSQEGKLYREVDVKLLTDSTATKGDILDGLDWIQKQTTSKDVAMIFLSGHGMNDPNGLFYYLPQDVDLEKIKRTGLPFSEVTNTVSTIAGKVIVFADACHSGNITGGRKGITDVTGAINELASSENGAIVFTSSTGKQYSLEKAEWGNGAFTKALLEGISGGADYQHTGRITIKMLDLFVSERVKELTDGKQAPTTVMPPNITDFPVVVK